MSTASSPTLPGSDERDELALDEHEIVDLHDGREHPDRLLVERIEGFSHTTVSRLGQLFTLGRYDPERAALDAAIAARAEERRRQRKFALTPPPLHRLAKKSDAKLEALRDQDRGYRHVIDYYQGRIRQESPEPKTTLGRWWKWAVGEGAQVKEYRRKLAMVEGAYKETSDKLAADPRERMQLEFAAEDRNLRVLIIQRAPQLAPQLPELLHALAIGNAEPLRAAVRGALPADEAERVMAVAQKLRGEYAGAGWRVLGAFGTVFTLGFNKSTRSLASGSKNERSVQLASFYARQADEAQVYNQLSVAGQMRTIHTLPVGSVLTVGGTSMVVEKLQESRGRRAIRLVQLDDARQIFLLDVTNPDAPVLRRAVGRGREVVMRPYRDVRSPLPAFAPAEARPIAPTPLETMTDSVFTAIMSNDLPAAESALAALDARLVANVLPGDDPSSLQEARAATLAALNYRLLAAARSPVRVFQDPAGLRLRVPSLPTPDPVLPPVTPALSEAERQAIIIGHVNGLLAALSTTNPAVRVAAAQAALQPLQALATAAATDAEAAAIARRATELIEQVYTEVGEPVPATVEISGRTLQLVYVAVPAAILPTEEERLTDLIRRVDLLITAFNAPPAERFAAMQRVIDVDLQPLVAAATSDAAAADLVRDMNDVVVDAYGATLPFTIVLGPRRTLSLAFPAALPLSEADLRERFADSLEAPLANLRALTAEHQRYENMHSTDWWVANRGRYVAFRTAIATTLRAEADRTTDVAYQRELRDFATAIERAIDADGNFPGGHPAIGLMLSQMAALQSDLRPASGVS